MSRYQLRRIRLISSIIMAYRISQRGTVDFKLKNWECFEADFALTLPSLDFFAEVSNICDDVLCIDFQSKFAVPLTTVINETVNGEDIKAIFNFEIEYIDGIRVSVVIVNYLGLKVEKNKEG